LLQQHLTRFSLDPLPAGLASPRRSEAKGAAGAPPNDDPLIVISNREPYIHEHGADGTIVVRRPPGGLVTGIEPLLRARGGTWIAHGSGSADAETVRPDGSVAVPPDRPAYRLKRIFLTEEEVERYYCGFANEALWPLCHRVHERPTFRHEDWTTYQEVNARFAEAALAGGREATILVQDYHLALVPRQIRNAAEDAVVGIFWHIPWPTAQMFEICPWGRELLDGLLGADVIGFHTEDYGSNFMDSVARLMPECEIDPETRTISLRGNRTMVRTYPISVQWPFPSVSREEGARLRSELGIGSEVHAGLAVDRVDYTKGLLERVRAVEALFEEDPSLLGRYTLVQLAAPSRQAIDRYQQLLAELRTEVARVNERFGQGSWRPIVLRVKSLPPSQVRRYYAMADSAVVTPLHDGMNLVAKEYVASCSDLDGALVLSQFAGAAEELPDALLVNPYDVREVALAIQRTIRMPQLERLTRMRSMRAAVAENTIDDWAANLLNDLASVRGERVATWTSDELLCAQGA